MTRNIPGNVFKAANSPYPRESAIQAISGWDVKRLGEIASTAYGYTASASYTVKGPKFLRITDIRDEGVSWDTVPSCKISKAEIEKYRLRDGDIVFARTGATTRKSFLV